MTGIAKIHLLRGRTRPSGKTRLSDKTHQIDRILPKAEKMPNGMKHLCVRIPPKGRKLLSVRHRVLKVERLVAKKTPDNTEKFQRDKSDAKNDDKKDDKDNAKEDAAATKIQANYRGYRDRKEVSKQKDAKQQDQAATKI